MAQGARVAAVVVGAVVAFGTLLVAYATATGWGEGESSFSTAGNIAQLALVGASVGCIVAAGRALAGRSRVRSTALVVASLAASAAWWLVVLQMAD